MPLLQPCSARPLENAFAALIRQPSKPKPPQPKPTSARDPLTLSEADQAMELVRAIERQDLKAFEQLLQRGAKPFIRTTDGRLPLVEAVMVGNTTMAQRLVEAGADPRDHDGVGRSALGMAWLQANGGPELDPSIAPKATGEARKLFETWQRAFPIQGMDDFFSPQFRQQKMDSAQAARLDLEPALNTPYSDEVGFAGGTLPWEQITSSQTLRQRQHERRAKLIGAPEKDPELLPLSPFKNTL